MIRTDAHRYVKLVLGEEWAQSAAVASHLDKHWRELVSKRLEWSPYRKGQIEYLDGMRQLMAQWRGIVALSQAYQVSPSPILRRRLIEDSEALISFRNLSADFVDDLKSIKTMVFGSLAVFAVLLLLCAVILLVVNQVGVRGRLEVMAHQDRLTGISNREHFIHTSKRANHAVAGALLMIDIDHFKRVNDRFGHGVGDGVLKEVAARLKAEMRQMDLLGRIGGEEFAVWLPSLDVPGALLVAERLRRAIEAPDFPDAGKVTISVGVSGWPMKSEWKASYHRADRALYQAKAAGRNVCRSVEV